MSKRITSSFPMERRSTLPSTLVAHGKTSGSDRRIFESNRIFQTGGPARFGPWLYRSPQRGYSLFASAGPPAKPRNCSRRPGRESSRAIRFPIEMTLAVAPRSISSNAISVKRWCSRFNQGFKFEEIARNRGAPVSTVKSRLYTALDLLKADWLP